MKNDDEIREILNLPEKFWRETDKETLKRYLNKIEKYIPNKDIELYTKLAILKIQILDLLQNYDKAIRFGQKALKKIESNNPSNLYSLYEYLGRLYGITCKHSKALNCYEKAKKLLKNQKLYNEYIKLSINEANIYLKENNFDEAELIYQKILKLAKKHKYETLVADINTNLGLLFMNKKEYKNSLNYYKKAIKIYQKLNNEENLYVVYANLSSLYFIFNNLKEAIEYAEKSIELGIKFKNWNKISQLYNNLGTFYMTMEDLEKGERYLLKSLEIKKMIGDKLGMSRTLNNLSKIYYEQKMFEKSIKFLKDSIKIKMEINDNKGVLTSLYNLAINYLEINKFEEAFKQIKKMETYKEKINDSQFSGIYELYYKFYEKKKDYKKALEYLKKYDEKYFEEIAFVHDKTVQALFTKFENEKAEKEKKIQYLKNIELKRANATKDKFFSIIAHDLKSPFSSITSFISLMKERYDALPPETIERMIDELDKNVQNTYSLLENLLTWSRLQSKAMKFNPKEINLSRMVIKVISVFYYKAKEKGISLTADVPKELTVFADEFMLDTVLRNLVNNAVKFTHNGGKIDIFAKQEDDFVHIIVSDNGVGIPKNKIGKLFKIESSFSTYGTNQEKGTGLGLILCKDFIERNNGTIYVESKVGEGTKFHIKLPI